MKTKILRTNLKQFRIGTKLTQEQFAKKIGVSRSTYNYIETGQRSGNIKFWKTLQDVFDVPDSEMWKLQKLDEE